MATLPVWPALGTTVTLEDLTVITSAGASVTYTAEIRDLLDSQALLTYDPTGGGVDPDPATSISTIYGTTVTALATVQGNATTQRAFCNGYSAVGDGGGGEFVWDGSSSATADGGTILGTGTGRWLRIYSGAVNPRWFGAKGDGSTNDHAALVAALAFDRVHFPDGTYLINPATSVLTMTSRTGIHLSADKGTTIKVASGVTTSGYVQMLVLYGCTDVLIEDITFDGNFANRSGGAGGAAVVLVSNEGSHRVRFNRCTFKESPSDGIYVRASSVATPSTYPTDLTVDDCDFLSNNRNGISLVGAKRAWILGGRFYDTKLGAPGCGIDIEPNASDTYGVEDVLIDGGDFQNNTGEGVLITAANASVRPKRVTVTNIKGRNNTKGLLYFGYAESCVLDGAVVADDTTAWTDTGLVTFSPYAFRCKARNLEFRNVTGASGGSTDYLVYCDNTGTGNSVDGIDAYNCSYNVFGTAGSCEARNIRMNTITAGDYGIYLGPGVQSLSGVRADSVTGRVIQSGATFAHISDVVINEPTATDAPIRITGGVNVIRDVSVYESGNAPGAPYCPISFDNAATIRVLENVYCYAAVTPYTGASAIKLPTSVSGSRIRNVFPNPFEATATWDPGSLASGASVTSSSITVTGAELGDHVSSSHSVDLQGLLSTAYVSAANTVKVVLSNLTGSGVDLASHTVTVEVRK